MQHFMKRSGTHKQLEREVCFWDTSEKYKVVARAYEKFFSVNEREETKFDTLQRTLKFPVAAYVKENGFLGIVSWNEYTDDFIYYKQV